VRTRACGGSTTSGSRKVQDGEGVVQGELFGGGEGALIPEAPVGAATSGILDAKGTGMPEVLRMGTSSWSFPGWERLVYDRKVGSGVLARHGLGAYASHRLLRTVGLDRGYYRPVPIESLREMSLQVPGDFRFVLKAPRQVTAPRLGQDGRTGGRRGRVNPDFLDPAVATRLAVKPFQEGLREKGGILLFQFPPMRVTSLHRGRHFLKLLGGFLGRLPRGPVYAVELRDPILWGAPLLDVLLQGGAIPGFAIHPSVPPLEQQLEWTPPELFGTTLLRWLLPPGRGYEEARREHSPFGLMGAPDSMRRERVAELCRGGIEAGRPTFIVVNNKAEGSAPLSVAALTRAILTGVPGSHGMEGEEGRRARQDSNLGPSA